MTTDKQSSPMGNLNRSGRKPGSVNKMTRTVKEAMEASFHEVGAAEWLVALAEKEPRAYAALLAKLIPNNLTVDGGLDVRHLFTAEQLRRMADEQEGRK